MIDVLRLLCACNRKRGPFGSIPLFLFHKENARRMAVPKAVQPAPDEPSVR